jgi:hypothetical protein
MSEQRSTAEQMRQAVGSVLAAVGEHRREEVLRAFDDPERTRWTYLPAPHPGIGLLEMDLQARKAFYRLLATALSRRGFAQAIGVMALEEVLDLDEGGRRGRHSAGFHLAVYGEPTDEVLTWRVGGHHLSVTATIVADKAVVSPLFLGARPHRIHVGQQTALAPVGPEEDFARRLVTTLPGRLRVEAIVSEQALPDIASGTATEVDMALLHGLSGIQVAAMREEPRRVFDALLLVYLDRLAPLLARAQKASIVVDDLRFAWAGSRRPGDPHSYRISGPDLLIEYCNADGDHSHSVLRRPSGDFGFGLLAPGFDQGP